MGRYDNAANEGAGGLLAGLGGLLERFQQGGQGSLINADTTSRCKRISSALYSDLIS